MSAVLRIVAGGFWCHACRVRTSKRQPHVALPIGRTARLAFEIDGMRAACCKAARNLTRQNPLNDRELEECARLDDALAAAHRSLKAAVRNIMLARLSRRSRTR